MSDTYIVLTDSNKDTQMAWFNAMNASAKSYLQAQHPELVFDDWEDPYVNEAETAIAYHVDPRVELWLAIAPIGAGVTRTRAELEADGWFPGPSTVPYVPWWARVANWLKWW